MAKLARKSVPQQAIIEDTVNNTEFRRSVAKGLFTTHMGLFRGDRFTTLEGYVGQNFYMEGIGNIELELGVYGFTHKFMEGQHRLLSPSYFGCPVVLTLHSGRAGDGFVQFNWEKGPVFQRSILENALNYWPLQPSFFEPVRRNVPRKIRKLNLGIVHSVSSRSLRAWIFLGTKWIDELTLDCPVMAPICNLLFEESSIPDLAHVDDSSDYGVDFGERATGT